MGLHLPAMSIPVHQLTLFPALACSPSLERQETASATSLPVSAPAVIPPRPLPPGLLQEKKRRDREMWLASCLNTKVQLVLTANEKRLASMRRPCGELHLRVVARAVELPDTAWETIVMWVRKPDRATTQVLLHSLRAPPHEEAQVLKPPRSYWGGGVHHNLAALLQEENQARFGGRYDGKIIWGMKGKAQGGRRRHLRLGSYSHNEKLIRIHPTLDRAGVPSWILTTTIHHELLHWEMGPSERAEGRRKIHPPEFRQREALHPQHSLSVEWLKNHLSEL